MKNNFKQKIITLTQNNPSYSIVAQNSKNLIEKIGITFKKDIPIYFSIDGGQNWNIISSKTKTLEIQDTEISSIQLSLQSPSEEQNPPNAIVQVYINYLIKQDR